MEKFIFFRHRHEKEREILQNSFNKNIEIPEYILKKLHQTQEYDWKETNIKKCKECKFS